MSTRIEREMHAELVQLSKVFKRIKAMAVQDTRNKDKSDLVGVLATIHSECVVVLEGKQDE